MPPLALSTLSPASLAQAQTTQAPLIAPGRLALPAAAFGQDATILHLHIDRGAAAIDRESTFSAAPPSHQGRRYIRFGSTGTLYEEAVLPGSSLSNGTRRYVLYMATSFPTTGAAQAVYKLDTAFLGSTYEDCARPDLVAVAGRYSTRACQFHGAKTASYMTVTGLQGNVEFVYYTFVGNDRAGGLQQVENDASPVGRAAFAAYRLLPVRRGPAPVESPSVIAPPTPRPMATATAVPQPTVTPRPLATSVPVSAPMNRYRVFLADASVS